jgi:hypothetical protein
MAPAAQSLADLLTLRFKDITDEPVVDVEFVSGLVLPSPVVAHVELAGRPPMDLRLEVDEDGEVVVTQVTFARADGARALTASAIRSVPFKLIVDEVIRRLEIEAKLSQPQPLDATGGLRVRSRVLRTRTRRLIDDALLTEVAAIVRFNPAKPNEALRTQMHTSARNASRWIAAAKQRGFLNDQEVDNG